MVDARAETPTHKRAIVEKLLEVWLENPHQRLGQLIFNSTRVDHDYHYHNIIYNIEDEELAMAVHDFNKRLKNGRN